MSFLWGQRRDKDEEDSSCSDEGFIDTSAQDDDAFVQTSSLTVIQSNNHTPQTALLDSLPTMTWEQAYRLACLKNNSLKATRWQIESQFPVGQEIPDPETTLLVWKDSTIIEQLVTLLRPSLDQQLIDSASSSSSSSWRSTLWGLWTFGRTNRNEDEEESEDEEPSETLHTDLQEEWIHPAMARSLLEHLASILKTQSHDIVPLSSVLKKKKKQQDATDAPTLLSNLPIEEVKVLCQVLERTGVAVSVHTTPSNECVLVTGSDDISTRLVDYDLQQTARRLEQEYTVLEEQAKKYRAAALAAKQRNMNPLPSMKLYKLCESQMAHKQNHLLQITTIQMTLRQAVHNRSVVQVMGSARTVLRDIHKELEHVHDVMDDVKEAMQDQEEINAAWLQSTVTIETDEEDELLAELQNLTLDEVSGDHPNDKKENNITSIEQDTTEQHLDNTTGAIIAVIDDKRIVDNLTPDSEVKDDKNGVELSPIPIPLLM
jgi:hypothetical protein